MNVPRMAKLLTEAAEYFRDGRAGLPHEFLSIHQVTQEENRELLEAIGQAVRTWGGALLTMTDMPSPTPPGKPRTTARGKRRDRQRNAKRRK